MHVWSSGSCLPKFSVYLCLSSSSVVWSGVVCFLFWGGGVCHLNWGGLKRQIHREGIKDLVSLPCRLVTRFVFRWALLRLLLLEPCRTQTRRNHLCGEMIHWAEVILTRTFSRLRCCLKTVVWAEPDQIWLSGEPRCLSGMQLWYLLPTVSTGATHGFPRQPCRTRAEYSPAEPSCCGTSLSSSSLAEQRCKRCPRTACLKVKAKGC